MIRCFFWRCVAAPIFASLVAGAYGGELTIDDLIARNTEAMGGREKVEAVHAVELRLHIQDPRFEVDGIYRAARPGRMRIDIMAKGERVYMERFDGEKGWQWNGKEEKEEGPIPTAALRHGIELPGNLFGLHEVQKRGNKLQLNGREDVDGVQYYVLRLTFAEGYESFLYLDARTWRITRRREQRALHPDVDPTRVTIESLKSDWRQVDGVWFAFRGEDVDLQTGKVLETTRVDDLKVNPPLARAIFMKL